MSYSHPEVRDIPEPDWALIIKSEKSHRFNYSNRDYWGERDRLEAERGGTSHGKPDKV